MKKSKFVFGLFYCLLTMATTSWAAREQTVASTRSENRFYVDLILLQFQYRYEDTINQEKALQNYASYDLVFQWNDWRTGLQMSQLSSSTGNPSYMTEVKTKEYLAELGYQFYTLMSNDTKHSLGLFGAGYLGETQTTTDRTLLNSNKVHNESDPDTVMGLGVGAVARIYWLLLESDFKILQSRNMSPQQVPVFGMKLGLSIPL